MLDMDGLTTSEAEFMACLQDCKATWLLFVNVGFTLDNAKSLQDKGLIETSLQMGMPAARLKRKTVMLDIEAIEARLAALDWEPIIGGDVPALIAEVRRLHALKLPASQQVYNITKELLRDAEAEVAELTAEAARLREDAARYQWLRARDVDTIYSGGVFIGQTPDNLVLNLEDADHAIDKARAALRPGQGEEGSGG